MNHRISDIARLRLSLAFFFFLIEKNQATLSAQSLREQYILRQREKGVEIYEIARNLGLKTMMTLEKYR